MTRSPESACFQGRGALITGAASGMGLATAQTLALAGADLVLADLNTDALNWEADKIMDLGPGRVLAVPTDVSSQEQVEALGRKTRDFLESVDYLAASAGILRRGEFTGIAPEEWAQVVAVNLTGAYLCCREVVPAMLEQGRGSIVLVSSMAGRSTSVWGGAHYTASKHGVIGLARHLARELGPRGIRVNAFCPGGTLTPLVVNATTEEDRRAQAARRPLRKWATAEEQARGIKFLLSDQAANITGAALDSNCGALMV